MEPLLCLSYGPDIIRERERQETDAIDPPAETHPLDFQLYPQTSEPLCPSAPVLAGLGRCWMQLFTAMTRKAEAARRGPCGAASGAVHGHSPPFWLDNPPCPLAVCPRPVSDSLAPYCVSRALGAFSLAHGGDDPFRLFFRVLEALTGT